MKSGAVLKRVVRSAVFALVAIASIAHASKADQEHEVKAAFIANFIKFIDWPDLGAPGSKFIVGVYGADDYGNTIDIALSGRSISGHPIVVQQIHSDSEIKKCRIVVSGATSEDRIYHLERLCDGTGTVLIGDSDDFARYGGAIGFLVLNSQVRFDVNLDAVKRSGASISSKLLSLAHEVYRESGD